METTWLPVGETPQTRARSVNGALLSMDALATVTPGELRAGLEPLVAGYEAWLDEQETESGERFLRTCRRPPEVALWEARQAHERLVDGLEHVATDAEALRCFQFMNRVMRDQRMASQVAAERASDASVTFEQAQAEVASGVRMRLHGARSSWRSS